MGFALLGVVAMQYYFLRQSYQLQSQLFDRDVREALNTVVAKLARQDANQFMIQKANSSSSYTVKRVKVVHKSINPAESLTARLKADSTRSRQKHNKRIAKLRDSLKRLLVGYSADDEQLGMVNVRWSVEEYTDELGYVHQRPLPPEITTSKVNPRALRSKLHKFDTVYYRYVDPQLGQQIVAHLRINPLWQREQDRKAHEHRVAQIRRMLAADSIATIKSANITVMENLAEEYKRSNQPLKARINALWVDSLLRFELANKGISLPFSYEVSTASKDSLIFSKAMDLTGEKPVFNAADTYQTPIFSQEVINDPGKLKVYFPEKNAHILKTMTYTMATSGGLLLALVVCFGYTIFSILRQKKISEMKTDFINNMTHEFKTPVSTIMIASEALRDQDIIEDKQRVSRLANIIFEENERLGSHIERVLNIARIEKNDFKLDNKPLDVNDLITEVLDSMALKLQKYNADVDLHLDADNPVITGDELHFSNVLYNLIDNAIKYSREAPQITITTSNKNDQLVIRVADKGIGMTRDQQSKIFEQFYRVPTGNLHDVKGFGLGLSYVNTIVKRLDGMISVKSEKDKGSEFELKFGLMAS
ncbi:HAMP domain-containing histidine kinase [Mucilaginibacter sp. Bleaf8]|nr:HAMP domain-containing histidine kinase [Mucilaginibacter sp. Bleaf8]